MRARSTCRAAKRYTQAPHAPMSSAAHGSTVAHPAVTDTSPARMPLHMAATSHALARSLPRAMEAATKELKNKLHDLLAQEGVLHATAEQMALKHAQMAEQAEIERAALLGEVAAAVGRDPGREVAVHLGEQSLRLQRGELGAAAGAHERQGAGALHHEVGQHPGAPWCCGSRPCCRT